MPPELVALTDGPNIVLDKPILLFGRDLECDIRFDSRKISRKHCCIAQVSNYLVVRDLGSTNGIRINGVRVEEGCLRVGDELTVGNHRYQVRWDELVVVSRPVQRPKRHDPRPRDATARDGDDILELCDEPVPLADSQVPPGQSPPKPPPPPGTAGQANSLPGTKEPGPSCSPMIPEHIGLVPHSDIFALKPPPKPRSV